MSKRRQASQFFQSNISLSGLSGDTDIAEYEYKTVPFLLGALETRKASTFFQTDEDYVLAYRSICKLQIGLLMGAKEEIIREVRSMRGGRYVATYNTDLVSFPVGSYPGATLNDVVVRLGEVETADSVNEQLTTAIAVLTEIRDSGQTPTDTASIIGLLGQIASLLA